MKSLTVSVSDLDCASCAPIIKKSVSKIKGVHDVRTAIMINRVLIDYDPKEANVAEIKRALEKAGFRALLVNDRD